MEQGQKVIGSHTTYYRARMELEGSRPRDKELEAMKVIGMSRFSPVYLASKVYDSIMKRS